jgi:hypothetical protein
MLEMCCFTTVVRETRTPLGQAIVRDGFSSGMIILVGDRLSILRRIQVFSSGWSGAQNLELRWDKLPSREIVLWLQGRVTGDV